jgi:hypothetical protein
MTIMRKRSVVAAALLLLGAAGCMDLDVTNPNAADRARALALPGDVEALIAGSFVQWWNAEQTTNALGPLLSVQSFQHSTFACCFGMFYYSVHPRLPVANNPALSEYEQHSTPWTLHYRSLTAVRDALIVIESGAVDLGGATLRARAFGKFVQGLSHGTLALAFDQAFIVDETITQEQMDAGFEPRPYTEVMEAAIGYLDAAIALAGSGSFTIPATWMSQEMSSAELVRLAKAYKARFRANVARTPAERAAVDWNQVLSELDGSIAQDWTMNIDWVSWGNNTGYYSTVHTIWSQQSYQIVGMADQSGKYQRWMRMHLSLRHPDLGTNTPFTIITPDNRFPQGATLAAQRAAPGRFYQAVEVPAWGRPDRGTHRWSYYGDQRFLSWRTHDGPFPWFTMAERRLLAAEAHFHLGQLRLAADSINVSRVAAGLNPTDAAGTNTSCVPRLHTGVCGDLWEMLKWEKRLETQFQGLSGAPWYFDARGWGDLHRGTQLEFPVPCRELEVLSLECYTLGGVGGNRSSTGSSYAWPGE